MTLPSDFKDPSWDEVILHLVPSWHEKSTKVKRLEWPDKQVYKEEDIEEIPSWTTNDIKLLHKKTVYVIQILTLTSNAISLDDMMSAIEYKNRASFRGNYLDPLETVEFLKR